MIDKEGRTLGMDFHIHSKHSYDVGPDAKSPTGILTLARSRGVSAGAITDHNRFTDYEPDLKIHMLPGCTELTVRHRFLDRDYRLHVLVYCANDVARSRLETLLRQAYGPIRNEASVALGSARQRIPGLIIDAVDLTQVSDVDGVSKDRLADAILSIPGNRDLVLRQMQHDQAWMGRTGHRISDGQDRARAWTKTQLGSVHTPRFGLALSDVSHALARDPELDSDRNPEAYLVLAHPYASTESSELPRLLIAELAQAGTIQGIEVFHNSHTASQMTDLQSIADRHRLVVTMGSDAHWHGNHQRLPPRKEAHKGVLDSIARRLDSPRPEIAAFARRLMAAMKWRVR